MFYQIMKKIFSLFTVAIIVVTACNNNSSPEVPPPVDTVTKLPGDTIGTDTLKHLDSVIRG
jgi:hypothetical protein